MNLRPARVQIETEFERPTKIGQRQGGDMWCEHCQKEVSASLSPVTGIEQCDLCGNDLESTETLGGSSIAQTAHTLLKRWEQTRLDQQHEQDPQENRDPQINSASLEAKLPQAETTRFTKPLAIETPPPTAEQPATERQPAELNPPPAPKLSAPQPKTEARFSSRPRQQAPESQPEAENTSNSLPRRPVPQPKEYARETEPKAARPTKPLSVPTVQAANNDASKLISQATAPRIKPKPAPEEHPAEASTNRLQSKPESPPKPTRSPLPTVSPLASTPPSIERPTMAAKKANTAQEQKSPRSSRKSNWSAILGQLLVFCSALGMTGGIAIAIMNRFGSGISISEPTGWLLFAGSHLLFVLGVYTNLSSRTEQVLREMHDRYDELTKIIAYQQALEFSRQPEKLPTAARFQAPAGRPTETPTERPELVTSQRDT